MKQKPLLLSMIATVLCLTGCKNYREEDEEPIDPTKTLLYVMNFDGGFDSKWLDAAKGRFEEQYKNESFEEGKVGVQIRKIKAKEDGMAISSKLDALAGEVFFNESVYYYDFLANDLLLDVTDIVTEKLTKYGEEKSIEDKMSDEQIAYYKNNNKYYGVPHYAGYNGIMYDKDVFDDYGLWFKDSDRSEFIKKNSDTKSAGPDGLKGTYDDGLPATYDELIMLCNYMVEQNVTPFIWTGQYYDTYIEKVLNALAADCDGLEETMLNYTYEGTSKKLIDSIDESGKITYKPATSISIRNGYETWRSAGKYNSLKLFEKIVRNPAYYKSDCFSPAHLYTEAQKDFIESSSEGKPIAMMIEGCWWENECKLQIQEVADRTGNPKYLPENRNFGMMPFPKPTKEQVGEKSTIVDTHYSLGFIKKSIDPSKIKVAKTFLQFVNTDESLQEFSVVTNTVKALKYTISEENLSKMTNFGRSVYDLHRTSDVVYPYSQKSYYLDKQSSFTVHESYYSLVGGSVYARPITYFREVNNSSALKFFDGMYSYRKNNWDDIYKGYYR